MATFYADEIQGSTDLLTVKNIGDRINSRILTPRISLATVKYTMDGDEAAADIVRLFKAPQGVQIYSHLSRVYSDAIATTATLDIGDTDDAGVGEAADPDRWADGLDVAAAGWDLLSANSSAAQITPYYLGEDAWIECLFKTLVTPVAAKKLVFWIAYGGA
jgi:hypothetical protein